MLKSKHIFIQQGALTANDNGRKKFNKSEIRYEDEIIMQWISDVNYNLFSYLNHSEVVLLYLRKDKELLSYTQVEHFRFVYMVECVSEIELQNLLLELSDTYKKFLIASEKKTYVIPKDIEVEWLYNVAVEDVFTENDNSLILSNVRAQLCQNTLEKIKKINEELETILPDEKVVIYGSGYQTEVFLRYMNINRLNIIRVVDRKKVQIFDINVEGTERENLYDADVIIITPYFASDNIKQYLESLELGARVISVADLCGDVILTGHENIWAPDLNRLEEEKKVDIEEEKKCLIETVKGINFRYPYYCKVKKHVQYKSNVSTENNVQMFEKQTAIIIQGPVVYKQNFTLDTVKLYHHNFPNVRIILSVWEDETEIREWKDLELYNAEVVYVKKPLIRGYQNINLQLATSYYGLLRAKELGYKYSFKTRTDMRFYSPEMVALMYTYMKGFPLRNTSIQKERLVIFPPRYDYFYFISDFFMFGNVDDMLHYWDVNRGFGDEHIGESAETMLGIRYANFIGKRVENCLENLAEYHSVLIDYFAVVEDKMLDYVWYKYFYNKLWECEYHYNDMNFVDWLAEQEITDGSIS